MGVSFSCPCLLVPSFSFASFLVFIAPAVLVLVLVLVLVVSFFASSCLSIGGALSSCCLVVLLRGGVVLVSSYRSVLACRGAARCVACGSCRAVSRAVSRIVLALRACVAVSSSSRSVVPCLFAVPLSCVSSSFLPVVSFLLIVPSSFVCVVVLSSRACLSWGGAWHGGRLVVRRVSCLR